MKIWDFLGGLFDTDAPGESSSSRTRDSTIVIDVPAKIYYKELALYTAVSYIANAISMAEIRVYKGGKRVKDNDYFLLNVAPNRNETASMFWHKVVEKMVRNEEGALVVEVRDGLHVAEGYTVKERRPVLGNIYEDIVLDDGLTLNKKRFRAEEVYLFRMEDSNVRKLLDGMYKDYAKLMESAARAFKDSNGRKFKYHVTGIKEGDEEFNQEFETIISKNIKDYMESEYSTYVEYDGEELIEQTGNKTAKDAEDIVKLRKDIFETFRQAFKIPESLISGNIVSISDVCDVFLTFAVDPFANCITQALNKRAGMDNYTSGNYYKCYTGRIKHKDLFEQAGAADKLLSSATMCVDEIREELELDPVNEEWSSQFYLTKNYEKVEDAADPITEEGR